MYIEAGNYGPDIDSIVDVATIDELLARCKMGIVARVIIPMTYQGYGESLIDTSNRRSIQRDYAANRFTVHKGYLTVSAYQFKTHGWVRELIENLQEQYPVYDDSDHSQLEQETITEFVVDELFYAHIRDDNFPYLGRAEIERVLFSGSWNKDDLAPIEFWEFAFIEGGDTPAMYDKDFETLKAQFLERWALMPMGDSSE
jgi:hypothetical protein